MTKRDKEWEEVEEQLESMTLEELELFVPVVEALARAKSTGFLFDDYENLQ